MQAAVGGTIADAPCIEHLLGTMDDKCRTQHLAGSLSPIGAAKGFSIGQCRSWALVELARSCRMVLTYIQPTIAINRFDFDSPSGEQLQCCCFLT